MQRMSLFPRVRAAMQRHLNGYIQLPQIVTEEGVAKYITPSVWGNKAVRRVPLAYPLLCIPLRSRMTLAWPPTTRMAICTCAVGADSTLHTILLFTDAR